MPCDAGTRLAGLREHEEIHRKADRKVHHRPESARGAPVVGRIAVDRRHRADHRVVLPEQAQAKQALRKIRLTRIEVRTRRFNTLTYARSASEPEDISVFDSSADFTRASNTTRCLPAITRSGRTKSVI